MSSGTNYERLTQNTQLINTINLDLSEILAAIKEIPNRTNPEYNDTTATQDEILYGKTAYIEGTKTIGSLTHNPSANFNDKNAEVLCKLLSAYNEIPIRILTDDDKTLDNTLIIIPAKINGESLIDFSNLSNCKNLFKDFTALKYIDNVNMIVSVNGDSMFEGCENLVGIRNISANICRSTKAMFKGCTSLLFVPKITLTKSKDTSEMFMNNESIISIDDLTTSASENMTNMFKGCTNLKSLIVLDTSKCLDMTGMFTDCDSLIKRGLINILEMCINASEDYRGEKTLTALGLNEDQRAECIELSNYSAFLEAGWNL